MWIEFDEALVNFDHVVCINFYPTHEKCWKIDMILRNDSEIYEAYGDKEDAEERYEKIKKLLIGEKKRCEIVDFPSKPIC